MVGGTLARGNPDDVITGFASLDEARPGDLSFFSDFRYQARLQSTAATAVLAPAECADASSAAAIVVVDDPSRSFEAFVEKHSLQPRPFAAGIHASAVVPDSLRGRADRISVAANATIEEDVEIGDETQIGAGCFIGRGSKIGARCRLFANVTVQEACTLGDDVILHSGVVIGADGFGYEFRDGKHRKIRQMGTVQIDRDVEIGACSTVDRARFGRMWIGEGTKIDNLVQIAHNVTIGKHCIIVAGTGIAGSARIGDYVIIGAQVGITGHVSVGSFCRLGARAGVTKDIPAGPASYSGFPAMPAAEERRRIAASRRLPRLQQRVRALELNRAPGGAASEEAE